MTFKKPCNNTYIQNSQEIDKMCTTSQQPCCLWCIYIKKCRKNWQIYKAHRGAQEERDKLIPCKYRSGKPTWCNGVDDFLKAHPNWKTEVIHEEVEFT